MVEREQGLGPVGTVSEGDGSELHNQQLEMEPKKWGDYMTDGSMDDYLGWGERLANLGEYDSITEA